MRFFFRSRSFKIFISAVAVVLVLSVVIAVFTTVSSPISSLLGTVTTPVQKAFSTVSGKIDKFKTSLSEKNDLLEQIEVLKVENAQLADSLAKYEETVLENDFYEQYLGIKDANTEMLFQSASVTARDFTDPYKGFTVDVGLLDGVSLNDPVITSEGLVGYISEIAPTYAKVTTVLSPKAKAGGKDNRTADEGVISGRSDFAKDNKAYFYNLQRDCSVSIGDYVVTAGGSVYPAGLIVGTVSDIRQQNKDSSLYAVIDSKVDFDKLRNVMIITYYSGQGSISPKGDRK